MSTKMNHSRSGRSTFWMREFLEQKRAPKSSILAKTDAFSLSNFLWQDSKTQEIARDALGTEFIQGIKNGNLHPDNYGGYMVQDAVYCESAAGNYEEAASKSSGEIREFMYARYQSFLTYYKAMFEDWHIENSSAIALGQAAIDYIDFENNVVKTMDPLYLIAAMIPCSRLWSWMAEQLKPFATANNVYKFWINENIDEQSAVRLEEFLDEHCKKLSKDKCLKIYHKAMQSELSFFTSATQ